MAGDPTTTETESTVPDYLASPNAVFADKGVQWRYGRAPDYSKTRKVWAEGKKSNHAAGSLPEMVENLVKNWEVEASFKPRLQDWRSIDHQNYTFAMNGGCPQSGEHMLKVGTYNAIIEPNEYYSPENSDFASSHKTFKRMMPTFAWEVVEVYSGPPVVAFKWRHWGTMKNDYVGFNNKGEKVTAKAHGGPIEIFGVTVAKVDDKVRLQAVDTWMDPLDMFRQIAPHGIVNKETMNRKVEKEDALDKVPEHDGVKIAQEHNAPNGHHVTDPSPEEVAPKHILESSGQAADAFVPPSGGCPFTGHQNTATGAHINGNTEAASANGNNHHPASSLPPPAPLLSEHLAPTSETSDGQLGDNVNGQSNGDRGSEMDIDTAQTNGKNSITAQAQTDTVQGAENSTGRSLEQTPAKRTADEEISRSIYSSSVTGSVENVIKVARSDDYVDESVATGTYDAVDEHLEKSSDEVHPHPKDVEESVAPDAGEAVVAPAASDETRTTLEEMSDIRSGECGSMMNRE